jgi:Protein of unknown function (DUF429)
MRWLGIDFSGGAAPWRERVSKPTVWVAFVDEVRGSLVLVDIKPVQEIAGEGNCFQRLTGLLKTADFAAAAIDAPFSIPSQYIPRGDHKELVMRIGEKPSAPDRPFPRGAALLALAETVHPRANPKPLRTCEAIWADRRINTRSTLWNGPRGGAPFAAACLSLIAKSARPCWPWTQSGSGILVEAFPAAQLHFWNLPHQGYSGVDGVGKRRVIMDGVSQRLAFNDHGATLLSSPDALDAVLAVFAAIAITRGAIGITPQISQEGWIAVHE